MGERYVVIETVSGRLEAEILCSFLRSRDIQCEISQEAAATVYGMGVGRLARADILVPTSQAEEARQALEEYHNNAE